MQLFNIILFWIFFGALSAFFAKKKERNPLIWFAVGLLLGVFGILLLFLLPPVKKGFSKAKTVATIPISIKNEVWTKYWYYLDHEHKQKGPFELIEFINIWKQKGITEHSLVWGEGMAEWKRLSEIPDVLLEMKK